MTTNSSTTNPARRAFLSRAASVAAGSAALTMAAAMPSPAAALQNVSADDPIYAAIEAHKAARAAVVSIIDAHEALEEELPRDKCESSVTVWEENVVATDDPRWIECERAVMRAWEAEDLAAVRLVCIKPTTRAGFLALLDHVVAYDTDGEGWPREFSLIDDDGERTRNWHQFLMENLVASARAALGPSPL